MIFYLDENDFCTCEKQFLKSRMPFNEPKTSELGYHLRNR